MVSPVRIALEMRPLSGGGFCSGVNDPAVTQECIFMRFLDPFVASVKRKYWVFSSHQPQYIV
jgi:hypothetical protein